MGKGKLIVIEGTDGSGKATQSKELLARLAKENISTAYFDFPQYGQKSAGMVENYLNGKYGSASEVNPRVASMFYALDRYDASFKMKKDLEEGKTVICNRYVSANMGHQTGMINGKEERIKYLEWLEELEFGFFNIPRPDMVILLYVPYLVAQKMVDKKGHRDYVGGSKRDILEADTDHLRKAEGAYIEVAKRYNWNVIDCTKNGEILSVPQIHEMIWKEVKKVLDN
ncbi:Thymidylate kinase [uncultured archaeon]|nr:Thymidylate kinase [uncultured archaeon]